MQLKEAVSLIQHTISLQAMAWADLGCGDGLFTNALSQLLADGSTIYAVDKNKRALNNVVVRDNVKLEKLVLNFITDELPFKNLSGILMANAFHYVKDKKVFVEKLFSCLDASGYILMVEYDTNKSNPWVPYPLGFTNLKKFFADYNCVTEKLREIPSAYQGSMYAAIVHKS